MNFLVFYKSNDFFLKKTLTKNFLFIFIFTFVQKFRAKKKKRLVVACMCIWMFSIALSHFERITLTFVYDGYDGYDGCHNHFWRKYFYIWFVAMNWWQSQLGWVHIWGGGRENKMSKDECEFFTTKLGWIISPRW
jgi:hypothetical protein